MGDESTREIVTIAKNTKALFRCFVPFVIFVAFVVEIPQADPASVPPLALVDMDGREWTAADLRGRVTLIDFWATWCAPCLAELPVLKEARRRYPREEFEILGISFDTTDRRSFVSWLNRQRVDWPQIYDRRGRQGEAARRFGVAAVPVTILVDPEGRIAARNLRGERLLAAIDYLVNERRRPATSTPPSPRS